MQPIADLTNDLLPSSSALTSRIGEKLVADGLISPEQIALALQEQQASHLKLGEIILEHGWIRPIDLYSRLESPLLCIGEILVIQGSLTVEQVRLALAEQRQNGFSQKIGHLFVERKWLTPQMLELGLRKQIYLRKLALPNAWKALYPASFPPTQVPVNNPAISGRASSEAEVSRPQVSIAPPPSSPINLEVPVSRGPLAAVPLSASDPKPDSKPEPNAQLQLYRKKIAALEIQMEEQQLEWGNMHERMHQQLLEFQKTYQSRIEALELQLKRRQTNTDTIQAQVVNDYRQRLKELETQLQSSQSGFEQSRQSLISEVEKTRERMRTLELELQGSTAIAHSLETQTQTQKAQIQELAKELSQSKELTHTLQEQLSNRHSLVAQPSPSAPTVRELELARKLAQAQELLTAYRSSLDSLQEALKVKRDQNRLLNAQLQHQKRLTAAAEARAKQLAAPTPLPTLPPPPAPPELVLGDELPA